MGRGDRIPRFALNFSIMNSYSNPSDKAEYLAENGWHFNKKACEYAVQFLKGKDNKPIKPIGKEEVDQMLTRHGVKLENSVGWDYVYVANMAKSDMDGSPLSDEKSQAMYVKMVVDDVDAADGEIMACWYTKMIFRHNPVDWGMFL